MKQFGIGYHKAVKKIIGVSYHESNHYVCQEAQVFTFGHHVNRCKIMAAIRLFKRPCKFLESIMGYFVLSSFFLKHIYLILNEEYGIESLLCNDVDAIISRICLIQNSEPQMRTQW